MAGLDAVAVERARCAPLVPPIEEEALNGFRQNRSVCKRAIRIGGSSLPAANYRLSGPLIAATGRPADSFSIRVVVPSPPDLPALVESFGCHSSCSG